MKDSKAFGCLVVGVLLVACASDAGSSATQPDASTRSAATSTGGTGTGGTGGTGASGHGSGNESGGATSLGGGGARTTSGGATGMAEADSGRAADGGGAAATGGADSGGPGGAAAAGGGESGMTGAGGVPLDRDAALGDSGDASRPMDASTSHDAGDGASTADGPRHSRLFITHLAWDGNLVLTAAAFGAQNVTTGLAAGDFLCNHAAAQAGLGGVWIAWLSDGTHDAIERIADVGPWYRVDGAEVFADKTALAGDPLVPIVLDETGVDLETIPQGGGPANVPWTGTLSDGTRSENTCDDWRSDSSTLHGLAGANNATTDSKWSEATAPLCDLGYHLYCFEQ